jgi:hypothetical protein
LQVCRDHTHQLIGIVGRLFRRGQRHVHPFLVVEVGHGAAHQFQRMGVVVGEVVRDA